MLRTMTSAYSVLPGEGSHIYTMHITQCRWVVLILTCGTEFDTALKRVPSVAENNHLYRAFLSLEGPWFEQ